jgi:putative membrane protein
MALSTVGAADGAAVAKETSAGNNAELRAFAVETHRIVVRHIGELKAQP